MFLALRHALCTRFLFTGISSHLYHAEGWTIDDLMTEFTKQALDAYHKGFCDSWIVFVSWNIYFLSRPPLVHSHILVTRAFVQDIDGTRIRLVWIGCKGDWPFLRKELLLRLVLSVSLVPQQWNKCDSQPFLSGPNCCQPRHSILAPALLQSASAIDALLRTTNCKNTYRTVPRFNLNSSNGFDVVKLSCGWDSF